VTPLRRLYEVYAGHPRATMPIGIRVDDTVFLSITAADPATGRPEGDYETQLRVASAKLDRALAQTGMGLINVEKAVVWRPDAVFQNRQFVARDAAFPFFRSGIAIERPANLPDGYELRLDVIATQGAREARVKSLSLEPLAASSGVRIGPVVFAHDVSHVGPGTGNIVGRETAYQVEAAFDNLDRLLEHAGTGREQILRIAGFHRDLGEKDLMNRAMVERFSDASRRPVHKYVPAALPAGLNFALQALVVDGAERRIIEMEGIRHNDPISLGALAGNVFVSSRVQGKLEAGPREQAARLIEKHAAGLMQHIGGSLHNVTQTTWGIGDVSFAKVVEEECVRYWPDSATRPRLQILEADFPHSPLPRLEFLALL
jgi:enamine deaminase RidA (YjgF/YER057c/UK114 family)